MGKEEFFKYLDSHHTRVTFDDVRLKTAYSEILPENVNVESWFSRNIPLKIPIVSAAMDTVTESEMAIEMAILGGLGIIHQNMSVKEQSDMVARVKHHVHGLIAKPITIKPNQSVEEILQISDNKKWNFHRFPVINDDNKLVGIVTGHNFTFCKNQGKAIETIMSTDIIYGKPETTLDEAYDIMMDRKIGCLPLINEERELKGLYVFSDVDEIKSGRAKSYNIDESGRLRVGAAISVGQDALARLEKLIEEDLDVAVIDTAHADTIDVIETAKIIKSKFKIDLVVGNVSEKKSVENLLEANVDGIKIGQGPGSICTTTPVAGYGCPQISAVFNCSQPKANYRVPRGADGGARYSGDIAKAIGAGADYVMVGGMVAGAKEAPGESITRDGKKFKEYRGMGSLEAMQKHKGSRERYKQRDKDEIVPEGVTGIVPERGKLSSLIAQYVGGLKKGMGAVGAKTIDELKEKADFFLVTGAGKEEGHPHNVLITREPPNYSR